MAWFYDVPIVVIWISIFIFVNYKYGKKILGEIKQLFSRAYKNKIFLILALSNVIILLSQITIYATKSSYAGNAAFEPDQVLLVNGTLRMIELKVLQPQLLSSPAFSFYLILPIFALIYLINPSTSFGVYIITERLFSVFLGHILLIVCFNIIDQLISNRKIKAITFGFLCLNGLNTSIVQGFGRYVDVLMILFIALSVYYAIQSNDRQNKKLLYASIIFSVLALSSKLPGLLMLIISLFIFIPLFHFMNKLSFREGILQVVKGLIISVLLFIVLNPYFIIDFVRTWEGLLYQYTLVKSGYLIEIQPLSIYFKHIYIYQGFFGGFNALVGYVCSLVFLVYSFIRIVKKDRNQWSIFVTSSLSLAYFVVFPLFFSVYMVRYLLPSLMFSLILLGFTLNKFLNYVNKLKISEIKTKKILRVSRRIVFYLLLVNMTMVAFYSFSRSTVFNYSYYNDSRDEAAEWISSNIDNESRILSSAYFYVPEDFTNVKIQWAVNETTFQSFNPEYLCISSIQFQRNLTVSQSIFYEKLFNDAYNVSLVAEFNPDLLKDFSMFNPLSPFYTLNWIFSHMDSIYGPTLLIYQVHNVTSSY